MVCSRVNLCQFTSIIIRRKVFRSYYCRHSVLFLLCSSTYESVTLVNNKLAAPVTDLLISDFMAVHSRICVCFLVHVFKSTGLLAGHVAEGHTNTAYHPLSIDAVFTATP